MGCCKGILELCSQRERLTQPNGHATGTKAAERVVKIIRVFGRMRPGLRRRDSAPSATRTRDPLLRRHSVGVACHRPIWPDVGSSSSESGWVWPEIVLRHANPGSAAKQSHAATRRLQTAAMTASKPLTPTALFSITQHVGNSLSCRK